MHCVNVIILFFLKNRPGHIPYIIVIAVIATVLSVWPDRAEATVLAKDYTTVFNKARKSSTERIISEGDSLYNRGEYDNAVIYYMVACNRLSPELPVEELRLISTAFLRKGRSYYMKGGYAGALEAFLRGVKVSEQIGDRRMLGQFYNNIATIHCAFQEFEQGLGYYRKALDYCHKAGDRVNEYKTLVNMTGISTFVGHTDDARRYYRRSESLKDTTDKVNNFMSMLNNALIASAEGKTADACDILYRCLDYGNGNALEAEYICFAYSYLYENYLKSGDIAMARRYMELCLDMATKSGLIYKFVNVLNDYADDCFRRGDVVRAYNLRSRYFKVTDSIYNRREFDILKNAQFIYEMDKSNAQIAELQASEAEHLRSIAKQRRVIAISVTVILIVGALLVYIYRQKRLLDKSYTDLYAVTASYVATLDRNRKRGHDDTVADDDDPETSPARRNTLDSDRQRKLASAIEAVMENADEYCNPEFSLDRMAELVGSNSRYVSQVINGMYHKNFSTFVNEYRVRLACLRMADTSIWASYTLHGLGESVGFKSYTTFVSVFRKTTGLTPKLYKEKAAAAGNKANND